MPALFSARSEYRSPSRSAFNMVGTEGMRSPGNIPRTFGALYSDTHPPPSPEFRAHGSPSHPMNMYGCPKQYAFGAIQQNPKARELPPILGRNLAFSWAGRTAHPDLTPATVALDRRAQPGACLQSDARAHAAPTPLFLPAFALTVCTLLNACLIA